MTRRGAVKLNWPEGVQGPSGTGRQLADSVFPIMPFGHNSPTTVMADKANIGSAFFITTSGAFLTARHLVDEYVDSEHRSLLAVLTFPPRDGGRRLLRCAIRGLQLHPTLDVAFGVAAVGGTVRIGGAPALPRALTLSRRPLSQDDPIAVFGYSHTRALDVGLRGLSLEFWPTDHHGHVIRARTPADNGYRGHREYVIDAETLGGTSGAPVVNRSTLEVHAVISTGVADACGFAIDVREFVDSWPLDALNGTIAEFAEKHPNVLRLR